MRNVARFSRRRIERRQAEILASLHMKPAPVVDSVGDVIFCFDVDRTPRVVPPKWVNFAATVVGGEDFARVIAAKKADPGYVRLVIVVGDVAQLTQIRLRHLSRGGVA